MANSNYRTVKHLFVTEDGDDLVQLGTLPNFYKVLDTLVDYDPAEDVLTFTYRVEEVVG